MRALEYDGIALAVVNRPDPVPLPGQVVVAVGGAGLCHSDLTVMSRPVADLRFPLPLVLGHELAGTVVEVGSGVVSVAVGDRVAGYGPRGCGACLPCGRGEDNYCRRPPAGVFPPGLGSDGALAELVTVDVGSLVPADGLDLLQAAALTDAGVTALHAVRRALAGRTVLGGASVLVMGVGGLGHVAVQLLRHLGVGRIIAVDVSTDKLELARSLGATDSLLASPSLPAEVRDLTGGGGVDVVLDLVASDDTLVAAAGSLAPGGTISVVGVGSGRLAVGMHAVPLGTRVDVPFWGTRSDLHDILSLARAGHVSVQVRAFGLDQAVDAYGLLERGALLGRAVVQPALRTVGAAG